MGKIIKQFFIWSSSGLILILVIWIVLGNLIATLQEKKIDTAKEQFRKQFPKQETNNSALKLEELTTKLGIPVRIRLQNTPARYLRSPRYEAKAKEFENIQKELVNYIASQLEKPNDEIDIPPKKLQQYIYSNADVLEAIQNHVLKSELPQWEIVDTTNLTVNDAIPCCSLISANFNKLLILNILDKTRLEKNQEALKSLEVSWKINQSLLKRPDLISQLVYIINGRPQTAVMRKLENLPPVWKSRIEQNIKYDLPYYFLNSFVGESFVLSNTARQDPKFVWQAYIYVSSDPKFVEIPSHLTILNPIVKPYFRLAGIDYWDKMNRTALELPKEYHCSFEAEKFAKKYNIARAWWHFTYANEYTDQWGKVIQLAVQTELTQKTLQVKEIANKQGNWPKKVPGIESSAICKDAKWIYQVAENGTMSISLSKEFELLKKRPDEKFYIPFSYSAKYKNNLQEKEGL